MFLRSLYIVALTALGTLPAIAGGPTVSVAMVDKGLSTFYVPVTIEGAGTTEYLLDTGASYMTINQHMLGKLRDTGSVEHVRDLIGTMADGRERRVPIYRIGRVEIGAGCVLEDVEAAVLPGGTRNLLGLSALRDAAPLRIHMDPPRLELAGCSVDASPTRTAQLQ
ncbi:retroviral-like aspartic protease family protein [Arhodomonas sp. AD133]|uniref:retroviral-like aspartic protease family protein n=1 Tax=Arhodomonas sp. AD133 TaxID=3415009 RepID=UPI003EC064DB